MINNLQISPYPSPHSLYHRMVAIIPSHTQKFTRLAKIPITVIWRKNWQRRASLPLGQNLGSLEFRNG